MDPVNIIPKNLELHEQYEKDQELQNNAVALTYEKALKHIVNLLSREEFLKYYSVKHAVQSHISGKKPKDFGENLPLIAAAVNKKTAKIFLILKNEENKATFMEWDYFKDQESFQIELSGYGTGYYSHIKDSPLKVSYETFKGHKTYLKLETIHYNFSYPYYSRNVVDGLRDINLEPLTNSNQIYLPPRTSEIFHKFKDLSPKMVYINEVGECTYQGKEFFLEKIVSSHDFILVEREDLEFIRTISLQRKNAYSVQRNSLEYIQA